MHSVEFTIGPQEFDDPAYGTLDTATMFGVEITEDYGMAPFFLEGGIRYGYDRDRRRLSGGERVTSELSRLDFNAGLRLEWPIARGFLVPYASAGGLLAFVTAELDDEDGDHGDHSDSAFGYYWKLGLAVPLTYSTYVGFEVRGIEGGEVSTDAFDAEIDSTQAAIVFGLGF